jgi:hypothetical protein
MRWGSIPDPAILSIFPRWRGIDLRIKGIVPEISRFPAILHAILCRDRHPPHSHAAYGEQDIARGEFPKLGSGVVSSASGRASREPGIGKTPQASQANSSFGVIAMLRILEASEIAESGCVSATAWQARSMLRAHSTGKHSNPLAVERFFVHWCCTLSWTPWSGLAGQISHPGVFMIECNHN